MQIQCITDRIGFFWGFLRGLEVMLIMFHKGITLYTEFFKRPTNRNTDLAKLLNL